jgi:hypothetical protein
MDGLELFAILVLAGAIIILLYYYIRNQQEIGSTAGWKEQATVLGDKTKEGISNVGSSFTGESTSGRMRGVGEKIKGSVKDVPISTDKLTSRIDLFLDEKSDQLIKDWDLATKKDLNQLEKRFSLVSRNIGDLERRFNEHQGYTNKKLKGIEERLENLENPEEETKK